MESSGQKGANKERTSETFIQQNPSSQAVSQPVLSSSHQKNLLTSQQQKQSHAAENSQYSAHSSFVFQNSDIFHQMQRVQSDEGDRL
jgi:hypothetical protein